MVRKGETSMKKLLFIAIICLSVTGCNGDITTGYACLGANHDSLVEGMQDVCKKGDAIATKYPAYFCDFNYAIAYNNYNSAICIYSGKQKPERAQKK